MIIYHKPKLKSTCKDCTERSLGCHDSCDKYLAAKKAYINEKKKVWSDTAADRLIQKGCYDRAHYRFEMRRRGRKIH